MSKNSSISKEELKNMEHDLNKAIYMLHFLEEEKPFDAMEIQNVCFSIRQIIDNLQEIINKK